MTLEGLRDSVVKLRESLAELVGQNTLPELTIAFPTHDNNEASFLWLVAWSYVLLFEVGRISIPYLLQLPSNFSNDEEFDGAVAREFVHSLRTWCFHNLDEESVRDRRTLRRVGRWFERVGIENTPDDDAEWQQCSQQLCREIGQIVKHCQGAVEEVFTSPDDGQDAIDNLKFRIQRDWPTHQFDMIVGDAAVRLGVRVNSQAFRESRLSKWREYLRSLPESDDPEALMVRMIERDLLDFTADLLPIDGNDVMRVLEIEPGPEVAVALRRARELLRSGIRNPEQLLNQLWKERVGEKD